MTSGGATTTIFDDLQHNGAEIRTSADSATVIFGAASGAGACTGTGTWWAIFGAIFTSVIPPAWA